MTARARCVLLTTAFFFIIAYCFSQKNLPVNRALQADSMWAISPFLKSQLKTAKQANNTLRAYPGSADCQDYTFSLQTGGADNETVYAVRLLTDGNYILGGAIKTGTEQSGLLIKLDKDGSITWANKYSRPGFKTWYKNIRVTDDGSWIAAGIRRCFGVLEVSRKQTWKINPLILLQLRRQTGVV